jgi:hypothetical protein
VAVMTEREFLLLIRDKVDLLAGQIAINEPLIEISRMITDRLMELDGNETNQLA